jgi:D-arabinose 1-dehydrogenase-like Zn-dependent alcohol dehydrogenase
VHDGGALEQVGIQVLAAQPSGACVGVVDDAGEGSAVLLGKRVLVPAFDPCGQCDICRRGGAAVCPLGTRRAVARRVRASSRWVVALGDGLELPVPAAAAVAGDVATAYTLYARTGLGPRDPVVVTGASAVTRFLVEILRAKGLAPVVVAAPGAWADWLLAKGCAVVSDAAGARADAGGAAGAASAIVAGVTSAIAAQGLGARPLRLIATGDLERAASLAGPRATLTVLAPGAALPADLIDREVTVIGVAGPHPDLIVEAAAMCVKGEIDLVGGVGVGETLARADML